MSTLHCVRLCLEELCLGPTVCLQALSELGRKCSLNHSERQISIILIIFLGYQAQMIHLTHMAFVPGASVLLKTSHNDPSSDTLEATRVLNIPLYISKN